MNALKIFLGSIYGILVLLLLLLAHTGGKSHDNSESETEPDPEPTEERLDKDTADLIREAREVGNDGDLKVTLLWDFYADIDLHVLQPNGVEIFFNNKQDDTTGGFLDEDDKIGGPSSAENVYWENPPAGTYRIGLKYFGPSAETDLAESGICKVVVFQAGRSPKVFEVPMNEPEQEVIVTDLIYN